MSLPPVAIAACFFDLTGEPPRSGGVAAPLVTRDLRLLPRGPFRATDGSGRPDDAPHWELSDQDAQAIVADAERREVDFVLDYEHATLRAKESGAPAPAAGWFRKLEWRADGLWAVGARFNARAAAAIAAGEYRYLSPVFAYQTGTGRVLRLLHAALTNDPGLGGLVDLAAAMAARFSTTKQEGGQALLPENMLAIASLLSLPPPAALDEGLTAILGAVRTLTEKTAALQARADAPDPAKWAPVAALASLQAAHAASSAKLAALEAQMHAQEVERVVEEAQAQGKVVPATRQWALAYGSSDLPGLQAFLASAPVLVSMHAGQTAQAAAIAAGASRHAALSAEERAICAQLRISEKDFLAEREGGSHGG